jgi:hypothetical protein
MKKYTTKVFDDIDRTDITYKQHDESTYDFYNRSALPGTEIVRSRIEEYASLLSEAEQNGLISVLKSNWRATYFELFLAKRFHDMGYQIATHPELAHTSKRPDFLLTGNGPELYAEARVATDMTDDERKEQRIIDKVIASINTHVKSKEVFLNVWQVKVLSKQNKSLKSLYTELDKYIKANKDEVRNTSPLVRANNRFRYDNGSIRVICSLMSKTVHADDDPNDRVIGMQTQPGAFVNPAAALERSIKSKASRYGKLNKPYVVCIQIGSGYGASDGELDDLLFGRGITHLNTGKSWREHDGMFGSATNPKMTRVSGVLFVETHESNPDESRLRYYKNLNAALPFDFGGEMETHSYDWETISVAGKINVSIPSSVSF